MVSMELVIERRAVVATEAFGLRLHPVLQRAYAARGVCHGSELALGLDRLVPVGTLDSIEAAVRLILEHRQRRILVVGDFDADGATSTALFCWRRHSSSRGRTTPTGSEDVKDMSCMISSGHASQQARRLHHRLPDG